MLWLLVLLLIVLWAGGFSLSLGGGLVHLLLVIALIVIVYNLFFASTGRWTRRRGP